MKSLFLMLMQRCWAIANRLSKFVAHDYCPGANRYVYWLKRPLSWFAIGALASALAGLSVAPQAWLVCAVLVVVMLAGTIWPLLALRGLSVEMAFDRSRCSELDSVTVAFSVSNRWPWPVWGLLIEGHSFHRQEEIEAEPAVALARIPAWSKNNFEFQLQPSKRGVYPTAIPLLATGFPFGLWTATRPVAHTGSLTVWPKTVDLRRLASIQCNRLAADGTLIDRPGDQGDVLATRPYQPGDSRRNVHWINTARRDALVVCERQKASRRTVTVILDPQAIEGDSTEALSRWDWSLRVMASLCREFHRSQWDVVCELNSKSLNVPPSATGLRDLFDQLARFQPTKQERKRRYVTGNRSQSLTIVITTSARLQLESTGDIAGCPRGESRIVSLDFSNGDVPGASDSIVDSNRKSRLPWLRLAISEDGLLDCQLPLERQLRNAILN